jgi:peptide deformylase
MVTMAALEPAFDKVDTRAETVPVGDAARDAEGERVLTYPDPRLRLKSEPIREITAEVRRRARAMFPLMYEERGIGLAAPQIGWNVRLFVVNVTGRPEDELVLVNPVCVEKKGGMWSFEEGCLSLPGIRGKVEREREVIFEGTDLDGEPVRLEARELPGRCLLHEYDHLDGVLFIDRLSPAKKQSIKRRLKELEEFFAEDQAASAAPAPARA